MDIPITSSLPNEMIAELYTQADYRTLVNLSRTNKTVYNAIGFNRYQQLLEVRLNEYVQDIINKLYSSEFLTVFFEENQFVKADPNRVSILDGWFIPVNIYIVQGLGDINGFFLQRVNGFNGSVLKDLNSSASTISDEDLVFLLKKIISSNVDLYIITKNDDLLKLE